MRVSLFVGDLCAVMMKRIMPSSFTCWDFAVRRHLHMLICVLLMQTTAFATGHVVESLTTACDWRGSSPSTDPDLRLVKPIDLRCSEGYVQWVYPYGALRITLQQRAGRDFYGCIRADCDFRGALVYTMDGASLRVLLSPRDGEPLQRERCFHSQGGRVVLFMEAELGNNLVKRNTAGFRYDLNMRPPREDDESLEACRPCNSTELVAAFCRSDYAVRGSIASVTHHHSMLETRIGVKVAKIHHQVEPVFTTKRALRDSVDIRVPLECQVKKGRGQFLFLGKIQLGLPRLQCAPRFKEWEIVRHRAVAEGWNDCSLD
ncbi:PREDICTED: meteorin-like protein [Priapulus caudatus]|uniref:Meteorin-like protein n=1 Tax=Priapulus caudatus TaxID=37621 RepID=A0ABM1DRB4_PRICU|nr:PREDICTED: meteorin-like protein [Priapulus caudatus]